MDEVNPVALARVAVAVEGQQYVDRAKELHARLFV